MNKNLKIERGDILIVGVPFDLNSSFILGSAMAPSKLREFIKAGSSNWCTEEGLDLSKEERVKDYGDIKTEGFFVIENEFVELLEKDVRIIAIGGDHSITYPILRAYSQFYDEIELLHFDAHPDLYKIYNENPYSHACPFARISEEKLVNRVVSVGIRASTPHQFSQAEKFGIEFIDVENIKKISKLNFKKSLYISLDIDCLDPAFAPGVSNPEPGGLSTREILKIIKEIKAYIIGVDIVEFNPGRDLNGITSAVVFKILKEILGRMILSSKV